MSTTNTPESNIESTGEGPNRERQNILELFDDVAEEKVFSVLHSEAGFLQDLQRDPAKIYSQIRGEMRRRLITTPKGYENFTESDIYNTNKLSDKTIREKLEILLVHVKSGQDRLKKRVESLFASETFADTPNGNDNRRKLNAWIPKQNSKDIEKYLKSPTFLRRKLGRECFGDERISTFVSRESVIGLADLGISVNSLSSEEKAAVNAIFSGAINSEQYHIQTYLKIIDRSPKDAAAKLQLKKNLLRTALPTVSPKFLVENGVITEGIGREKVQSGLENVLGDDYFITGTPEEKAEKQRYLDHVYEKSEHIELPIDDYLNNDAFIESLFTNGKLAETTFTKKLKEVLTDMRAEMTVAEFDLDGMNIHPDIDGNWHESFIENVSNIKDGKASKVRNVQNLRKGSYIRIKQDINGEQKYGYFRVIDTDVESLMPSELRDADGNPIKHRGLRLEDWADGDGMVTPGNQRGPFDMEYVKLWTQFNGPADEIEIITEDEMTQRRSPNYNGEGAIKTKLSSDGGYDSMNSLTNSLGWEPKAGMVYTTKDVEGGADFYMEILKIDESTGSLTVSDGAGTHEVSFSKFHQLAGDLNLKEVGKYDTMANIDALIQSIDGFKDVFIEDGVIKQKMKDADGHDITAPIHHFMNADGEGMYFTSIGAGGAAVAFGKVKGAKKKGKEGKGWDEIQGKVNLGAFKGNARNLSVIGMLNQLRENDYKPYINPKDKPVVDTESHMPHTHGSFWGRIMNGTSVSDMMKAFDLYKHAWEHKLEKNSKFQSAKFADKYLRGLMPEGFSYQLRSEAYAAQNEAMEGILKMLENDMSGKEARLYIRKKILLNDDAKFEEVLAGLLYISKKTGQLYPEELSDLKNSQIWFHKLAVTQGYNTKASRNDLRNKCIEKTDKAADGLDAVSEIDIIERQLKLYEGQGKRIPPNIAPKFPGAIVEGKKGSQEKGEMEVNQRTNIKQMNKYALSKLNVGEGYKVMGTIDRIHSKNGSAVELNAIPFTLLMSNMPEYMGSEFRKALHSEGVGPRASHAFKFGNELPLVNTYRSVVMLAAQELDRRNIARGKITNIASQLSDIEKKRHHIGDESHDADTEDPQKKWINSIYDFWMDHGKELQPLLQMSDTFIDSQAQFGDAKSESTQLCRAYKNRFTGTMAMQNGNLITGGEIYKNANVSEGNMVADHTPFAFTNMVNASFSAIYGQNGKMGTSSANDSAYGKIFKPGVLGALYKLRMMTEKDVPPGATLREVQYARFREYFAAIMYYLRKKGTNPPQLMIGGQVEGKTYAKMDYITDLERYGFDIKATDWRPSVNTIPAGAEMDAKTQEPNNLEIDGIDEGRCRDMFQNFLRSTATITSNTSGRVDSTFDWGNLGG